MTISPSDPDYEAWLDAQVEEMLHQETLDNSVRCPSCGYPMLIMGTDMGKPFDQGRYFWNCSRNETCGKRWESHHGELRERIPEDREI